MKISKGEKIFQIINVVFLILLSLVIIYPVVYTLSASFRLARFFRAITFFADDMSVS